MKQKTCRKLILMLLALCLGIFLSALTLSNNYSTAKAEASVVSSVEDNLSFTLNSNSTGYKVAAKNKQITEAMIPAMYNGLPVTEISDNGFMSCTKLTVVRIPYTVTRIGNNAFANCTVLEEVNGMPCVQTIGNNAFAMCKNLDNLILPYTITTLGNTILRSNPNTVYSRLSEEEMKRLNASWILANESTVVVYGNELVLEEVYDGSEQIGYAINRSQNLNADVHFVLGDTYNGLPLLEIETWAFAFSTFQSFTLKHGEIIADADEAVEEHVMAYANTYEDCGHTVNISSGAFFCMDVDFIDLLVDVTFFDSEAFGAVYEFEEGYSTDVFAGSTARRITLPNSFTVIPNSMFCDCENLREISNTDLNVDVNRISPKITGVGSQAFMKCKSLSNLYLPSSIVNMGESVFWEWGDSDVTQTIHLEEYFEAPVGEAGFCWSQDWLGTIYGNANVSFKTVMILFDKDGGKADVGSNDVQALYHQDMPEAAAPERDFYTFEGYYSERNGMGTQYYDGEMNSVAQWDAKTPTILYAYWKPYTYTVTFDKEGGTGGSDYVEAEYGRVLPEAAGPVKRGYIFLGYFTQPNGMGTKYYNANMSSGVICEFGQDITLYAHWEIICCEVTFDSQGGVGGPASITVDYGTVLPTAEAPTKKGETFMGYYTEPNGEGTRYYDSEMVGAEWDLERGLTLYAYWTPTEYTLTFDLGTGETFTYEYCYYNKNLPQAGLLAGELNLPTRVGYLFMGFFSQPDGNGAMYYNADMTPVNLYDEAEDLTFYADWEIITYKIIYSGVPDGVENPNPTEYTVESLPVVFSVVEFDGYRLIWDRDSLEADSIGDVEIQGTVSAIVYHITYLLNGGTSNGGNPETYSVAEKVVLQPATHDSKFFDGWFYNEQRITDLDGITGDIILSATWSDIKTLHITSAFSILRISDPEVIVIFETFFSSNCSILIGAGVEKVKLQGTGYIFNMHIEISTNLPAFSLSLENIGIRGFSLYDTISVSGNTTLCLYTYSDVVILGAPGQFLSPPQIVEDIPRNGTAAISCAELWILSADNLLIQGGKGSEGYNGGNGGAGVIVETAVYIWCDNVIIAGGIPGNGGNGYVPGQGGKGAYPVVGKSETPTVYVLEGLDNVHLYISADGTDGGTIGGIVKPGFPNPDLIPDYTPSLDKSDLWDNLIINPGVGGGGGIIIPEPPMPPIQIV